MAIRVLRVLEYEFCDAETAEEDMANWTLSFSYPGKRMRSASMPFEAIVWQDDKPPT